MAKTRTEKIKGITEQIEQLKNAQKLLIQKQKQQDRKDRTCRLCKRMGLFESLLPDTITLTDDLFKTFLEKAVLTDQSRRIPDGLTAQNAATAAPIRASAAAQSATTPTAKPAETEQENGADEGEDEETAQGRKGALMYHMNVVRALCRGRFVPIGTKGTMSILLFFLIQIYCCVFHYFISKWQCCNAKKQRNNSNHRKILLHTSVP